MAALAVPQPVQHPRLQAGFEGRVVVAGAVKQNVRFTIIDIPLDHPALFGLADGLRRHLDDLDATPNDGEVDIIIPRTRQKVKVGGIIEVPLEIEGNAFFKIKE